VCRQQVAHGALRAPRLVRCLRASRNHSRHALNAVLEAAGFDAALGEGHPARAAERRDHEHLNTNASLRARVMPEPGYLS